MGGKDDLPDPIVEIGDVVCGSNDGVPLVGKVFGDAAFPECVDAVLVGELSIVVDGGVEGDVGISDVVPQNSAPPDNL